MHTVSSYSLLLSIAWGTGPEEMPAVLEEYPPFSLVAEGQMRRVYAPVRLYVDPQGGLHALADAVLRQEGAATVYLYHFDAGGTLRGRTPLALDHPKAVAWRIQDYVVDAEGYSYVLETLHGPPEAFPLNRVRKVRADGAVEWARAGLVTEDRVDFDTLEGSFSQLLIDGQGSVYLPTTEPAGALARLDPQTGAVAAVYAWDEGEDPFFMDAAGTAYCVAYLSEVNRRALAAFDLQSGAKKTTVGDEALYGWLTYPIGVDRAGHFYASLHADLARIAFDGRVVWQDRVENVVVPASEGAVFVSRSQTEPDRAVAVAVYRPDGTVAAESLALPPARAAAPDAAWRLIHVDDENRRYVFGGEQPGQAGTLLIYSEAGDLVEERTPPPDLLPLESRLENQLHWVAGADGSIYLPVTTPSGFSVVRIVPR